MALTQEEIYIPEQREEDAAKERVSEHSAPDFQLVVGLLPAASEQQEMAPGGSNYSPEQMAEYRDYLTSVGHQGPVDYGELSAAAEALERNREAQNYDYSMGMGM